MSRLKQWSVNMWELSEASVTSSSAILSEQRMEKNHFVINNYVDEGRHSHLVFDNWDRNERMLIVSVREALKKPESEYLCICHISYCFVPSVKQLFFSPVFVLFSLQCLCLKVKAALNQVTVGGTSCVNGCGFRQWIKQKLVVLFCFLKKGHFIWDDLRP